jgi:hypothetical protein
MLLIIPLIPERCDLFCTEVTDHLGNHFLVFAIFKVHKEGKIVLKRVSKIDITELTTKLTFVWQRCFPFVN